MFPAKWTIVSLYNQTSTYLLGNWVADLSEVVRALAVEDLLGAGGGHEGADAAGPGLAVLDGHLLTRLPVQLLAVGLGHLGAPQLGLILKINCHETKKDVLDSNGTLQSDCSLS